MEKIIELYDEYLKAIEKKNNSTFYTWEDYARDLQKIASSLHSAYHTARKPSIRGIGRLVYNEVDKERLRALQMARDLTSLVD